MIARPKSPPVVVVELSSEEAAALVRAIDRAEAPVRAAGNPLDMQRLGALRAGLRAALEGLTHHEDVEP